MHTFELCTDNTFTSQLFELNCIDGDTIHKKALLGNNTLTRIFVPTQVKFIESWAFAYCDRLEEIWLPKNIMSVGNDIFLGDNRLKQIIVYEGKPANKGTEIIFDKIYSEESVLLLAAMRYFNDSQVYDFRKIGSGEWYTFFDSCLLKFIDEPDEVGYYPFLAGGEEDYDEPENNIEYYKMLRRKEKVKVIYRRLLQDKFLTGIIKDKLVAYIVLQNCFNITYSGCDRNINQDIISDKKVSVSLLAVLDFGEEAYEFFKLYMNLGLATEENNENVLAALSDDRFTECRAYFLSVDRVKKNSKDVWNSFLL